MEQHWEHIEKYLAGELSEEEKLNFEKEMEANQHLAEEVELIKNMKGGIRLYGNTKLKEKLDEIHQKTVNKPVSVFNIRRVVAIAASVAFLILAYGLWQWNFGGSNTTENLYAEYHQPYDWDFNQRGGQDNDLASLFELYQQEDYNSFIAEAEKRSFDLTQNPPLAMALGNAYEVVGNSQKAQAAYQAAATNPLFEQEGRWYQALSLIKESNIQEAEEILELISNGQPGAFTAKADELLTKLN